MIKTQSAKAKGRLLQQKVAKMITEAFELEEGDVESRSMGAAGVDIMLSPTARRKCALSIECKNTRKTPAMAEVLQAKANAYPATLPIVVWKPHRESYDNALFLGKLTDLLLWMTSKDE